MKHEMYKIIGPGPCAPVRRHETFGRKLAVMFLPLFMAVFSSFGMENILDQNQPYDKLSSALETPHIKWAKPYDRGEIRALVVAPQLGQRETVELAQRMSLQYTPLMTFTYTNYYVPGTPPHGVLPWVVDGIVRAKMAREYDVIIIGKVSWKMLPGEIRAWILKQTEKGAGLVYICPEDCAELDGLLKGVEQGDDGEYLTAGVPSAALPVLKDLKADRLLNIKALGRGRVVEIDYGQKTTSLFHSLTPENAYANGSLNYEYYHALLAKAVIWVARKCPEVLIKGMSVDEKSLHVKLLNTGRRNGEINVEMVIRDSANNIENSLTNMVKLAAGENEVCLPHPLLKEGRHFADVWLKRGAKVINWGSVAIASTSRYGIAEITLDKEAYKEGETLHGKALLKEIPGPGLKLRIQLLDNFDRVMEEQTPEIKGKEAEFDFSVRQPLTILLRVKAELSDSQQILSAMLKEFTVLEKKLDDYYLSMWVGPCDNHIGSLILKQFYDCGVDFDYLLGNNNPLKSVRANLGVIPYFSGYFYPGYGYFTKIKESDKIRAPCFNDPEFRAKLKKSLEARATANLNYMSYFSLSINGGISPVRCVPRDLCSCNYCQESFREYLKKEYGTLEALNKEWDTAYTNWADVRDMNFAEAKAHGNYAPWVDHRRHMEAVFTEINCFAKKTVQEAAPGTPAGIDEPNETGSYNGYDWWELMNALDFCNPYFGKWHWRDDQIALSRSFVRKAGVPTGIWFGTYCRLETFNRFIPWQSLFNGMRGVWWWQGVANGFIAALGPDLAPLPYFSQALGEINEIKGGLGKLLINSERERGRIALLYSPASVHAATIQANNTVPARALPEELISDPVMAPPDTPDQYGTATSLYDAQRAMMCALEDIGLTYTYVAGKQLETGVLEKENYKVLILSHAQALSVLEMEKIREFVRRGGLLIADTPAGIMDEHGRLLESSPLLEIFKRYGTWSISYYGEGKAAYLNDALKDYVALRVEGKEKELRDQIEQLLSWAGVNPRLKITTAGGEKLNATETVFFKNGAVEYACILKDYMLKDLSSRKVSIQFPDQTHVYDVREGKYCGYTDKVAAEIAPARARVYALVPYKIEAVMMSLDKTVCNGGEALGYTVKLLTSGKEPATHAVRLELINPCGQAVKYYGFNLLAEKGNCGGQLLLAHNEQKGKWKIRAREIISGKTAEADFVVK